MLLSTADVPESKRFIVFALVADGMLALPRILRAAFSHPWVASYQVGFGPPLVRATPELTEAVRESRTALDKMDAYLERCVLDEVECRRLAEAQRRLLVRRHGPVEAEALTQAAIDAIDLSLRLHAPVSAPNKVRRSMEDVGVPTDLVPGDASPQSLTGRFVVRLHDPRNARLLHHPVVALAADGDETHALALELRTPVDHRDLWLAFLDVLAYVAPFRPVDLGAPVAHARTSRDGARS